MFDDIFNWAIAVLIFYSAYRYIIGFKRSIKGLFFDSPGRLQEKKVYFYTYRRR